jgi:hypothetical protein
VGLLGRVAGPVRVSHGCLLGLVVPKGVANMGLQLQQCVFATGADACRNMGSQSPTEAHLPPFVRLSHVNYLSSIIVPC